jgi:Mg2+-importing ATPase
VGGQDLPIDARRAAIDRLFLGRSDQGYRVLGLATRCIDRNALDRSDESGMTFRGLLVFADPPKADAGQTIGKLRDLGVTLKIITGDNHAVAESISRRVGLDSARTVRGSELRQLDEAQLLATVNAAGLFVEVEPNQKEQIVLALKRSGQTVGFLGDGINDAPALHAADVGISVAEAVDVARDAAQVVLLKQDLAVLVEGVQEGRRTFANTLKYVFFAIAANFGYMFSLAVAGLVLPFEPLLAPQILLVNLLADFPAMALATDRVDPEQIQRPRRWDTRFILRFMMSFGLTSSCFDFMMFGAMYVIFASLASGGDPTLFVQLFQTGWFIQSTLTGLVIMAVIRTRRTLLRSQPGALFLTAVLTIAVVTIIVPFSPLGPLMGFVPPPVELLAVVLAITVFYGLGMEVVKHLFYRRLGDGA